MTLQKTPALSNNCVDYKSLRNKTNIEKKENTNLILTKLSNKQVAMLLRTPDSLIWISKNVDLEQLKLFQCQTHHGNNCISRGLLPSHCLWKIGIVKNIPILLQNWRPVVINKGVSKLLEWIMNEQLGGSLW